MAVLRGRERESELRGLKFCVNLGEKGKTERERERERTMENEIMLSIKNKSVSVCEIGSAARCKRTLEILRQRARE